MQTHATHFVQVIFFLLFLATIAGGWVVLKNYERLFGPDPDYPAENSSSRSYSKMQVLVVWLHAMALTGSFAFLLE